MNKLLLILFVPCLLFSQKIYDVKAYPFNAKGDGTTDDKTAIQKALDTVYAHNGVLSFPSGTFITSDTLRVRGNIKIVGSGKYNTIIKQTTLEKNVFILRSDSVEIRDLSISGTNNPTTTTSSTPTYAKYCGIWCAGDSVTQRKNITISNCFIKNYDFSILADFNYKFKMANCTIDSTYVGIMGGTQFTSRHNDTTMSYEIVHNDIRCTYGKKAYSRPITLPYNCGGALIDGNFLRGGTMSYETVTSQATYNADRARFIITNNDCDGAISGGNIISNNVIDYKNSIRGGQWGTAQEAEVLGSSFYQAIEPFDGAVVSNNIVRYWPTGIGNITLKNCIINNNQFYNCGSDSTAGLGGIITINTPIDSQQNVIIKNNLFYNTIGTIFNIYINQDGTDTLCSIMIDGNVSINSEYPFLRMGNVIEVSVTNNIIKNCSSTMTDDDQNTSAIQEFDYVKATYSNNEIISTLGETYGMHYGYAIGALSVCGFTRISGARSGQGYYLWTERPVRITDPYYLYNDTIVYYPYNNVGTVTSNATYDGLTARLSNLSDGYVPFHSSDANGLENSNLYYSPTSPGGFAIVSDRRDIFYLTKEGSYAKELILGYNLIGFIQDAGADTIASWGVPMYIIMGSGYIEQLTQITLTNSNTISDEAGYISFNGGLKLGTALGVAYGGTGATTLTGLLKGNGTGAVTAITAGTSAQFVRGDFTVQDLNQAAVAGLTTASSPEFAGISIDATGITTITVVSDTLFFTVGGVQYSAAKRP